MVSYDDNDHAIIRQQHINRYQNLRHLHVLKKCLLLQILMKLFVGKGLVEGSTIVRSDLPLEFHGLPLPGKFSISIVCF